MYTFKNRPRTTNFYQEIRKRKVRRRQENQKLEMKAMKLKTEKITQQNNRS